jgi:hypothetical protein
MRWVMGLAVFASTTGCGDGSPAPPPTHEGDAMILASGQGGVGAIQVTDRGVFWTTGGEVMWIASSGDVPQVLAAGLTQPAALCVTEALVYVVTTGAGRLGMTTIPGDVFRVVLDTQPACTGCRTGPS